LLALSSPLPQAGGAEKEIRMLSIKNICLDAIALNRKGVYAFSPCRIRVV
jgi:hypothetical protein